MTTAKKTAATRAAKAQAPTTETTARAGKIGDNAASVAAAEAHAAAQGDRKLTAKADQLKKSAQVDGKPAPTKRYRVLANNSVRSGGVRFTAGEAVDLTDDQAASLLDTVVQEWGDDVQDDDETLPPIVPAVGATVPNPDTEEGADLQRTQEQEAADAEAARLAAGLPSGVENK